MDEDDSGSIEIGELRKSFKMLNLHRQNTIKSEEKEYTNQLDDHMINRIIEKIDYD